MKIEFTPAVRRKTRARVALCGPSGSGKTYTALSFAHVFAPGSVALIDTEKESADGYEGLNGWHWVSFKPATYEPEVLIDALAAAAAAGIECVVIDSLSHFWMGTGGMLEQVDNAGRRSRSGNSFAGWKEMRPAERRMIDAMTSYPGHLIVTMRTKTEWVIQDNERGKKEPRRIGTKPEQREGIEYEFSVVADMDLDNVLTVTKTRVPTLKRGVFAEPGPEVAQKILDWLTDGGDALPDLNAWRDRALDRHATREDLLELLGEAENEHVDRATMQDETGETVMLRDLIIRKGKELGGIAAEPSASPAEPRGGEDGDSGEPAADAFENATPVRPNGGNGNGHQRSGLAREAPQADAEAQKFADEAARATAPHEMQGIHRRAREDGKLAALVRNPAGDGSGKPGKLAVYLDWRRKQVNAAVQLSPDDPWAAKVEELTSTADADTALDEVARMAAAGDLDVGYAARIENAVIARFPDVGRESAVAP